MGEQWTCRDCGSTEPHHAMLVSDGEIEVDVTCETVYLVFTDDSGDPGMAIRRDEFEEVIEHYENTPDFETAE